MGREGWNDLLAGERAPRFALICLGVWLNAADSLVTATIMPAVGADLGGYAYFAWAVAGFLLGAILAGASAGRLSEKLGLRPAIAIAGLVFACGCAISAAAPNVAVFLAGRLLQGIGGGWISGFSMVAIAFLFPERHLARVFAAVSGVWGVATLLGPALGGVFADSGDWRMVFWLFALQAVAFSGAGLLLLRGAATPKADTGVPWSQLAVLSLAVGAIATANVTPGVLLAASLAAAGVMLLGVVVRMDGGARVRLLPRGTSDLRTVCGSGYAAMFALTAASMGLTVYGTAVLQQLRGLSALWAGYVNGAEALGWTLTALLVASAAGAWDRRWIRIGAMLVPVSLLVLAWALPAGPLLVVIAGAALLGAAFGFFWSFMSRRVLAALSDEDRAIGSSAITAVRQAGAATGAAIAGVTANLVGFGEGLSMESARAAGVWVHLTALPMALVGAWAAWRLTSARARSV